MAEAKQGDTVRVHYTGKLESGEVFDTSTVREPLEFTLGEGQLIPGFEEAVVGMQAGEEKTILIPAEQAYGPRRPEMSLQVKRATLPADLEPQVGQVLQVDQGEGKGFEVTITEISEESVTLDANHPLAGKDLTFDIQLIDVV